MPKNSNTVSSLTGLRRRVLSRAVHRGRRWVQETGAVTARHPGRLRFGRIGVGTRLAFPQGTVFGERWIELGDHRVVGEQVTLRPPLRTPAPTPPPAENAAERSSVAVRPDGPRSNGT